MKNKPIVPQLREGPIILRDLPAKLPVIPQRELTEAANAALCFQLARADYEQKRAALTLKLLQLCKAEPGNIEVRLDEEGNIILTDWSSVGPADIEKLLPA
jgi:hypothetical protein